MLSYLSRRSKPIRLTRVYGKNPLQIKAGTRIRQKRCTSNAVSHCLQNIAADPTMPAMQIVNVAPDARENTWIASLRVQDGLADVETPTTILVEVEHQGESPRDDVLVSLFVDDVEVAAKG